MHDGEDESKGLYDRKVCTGPAYPLFVNYSRPRPRVTSRHRPGGRVPVAGGALPVVSLAFGPHDGV